jgi:hypothetical protein
MKAYEKTAGAEKRATKAPCSELPDEMEGSLNPLHLQQKAESAVPKPAVPQSKQLDDDDQGDQGKSQSWHAFQTP